MNKTNDSRRTKVISKYGYEYTLIEVGDRRNFGGNDTPNFMGNYGWALSSIKKIIKYQ